MSGEAAVEEKEFTEAELTGEPDPTPPVVPPVVVPDPVVSPVVPPVVPPVPGKEAEAVPGKEPAPPTPPAPTKDERTVPLAALHEERRARQELSRKLEELQARLDTEPRKTPAELILEDPENAMTVLMQEITDLRGEIARTNMDNMERDINAAVPNFLELAPQMEELLLGEGLSEETIRNLISSSGKEAPKFFKVLAKLTSAPSEETLRTKLTAELTPAITTAVTKDLMAKFKIVDGGVSLERLPGSPPDGKLNVNTEEEFAKLTPEQQQAWLSGG
jgi:hypothetical protein